jgi:hypothetical protein
MGRRTRKRVVKLSEVPLIIAEHEARSRELGEPADIIFRDRNRGPGNLALSRFPPLQDISSILPFEGEKARPGELPCGHSIEYDVKKDKMVSRPIYPGEFLVKPKESLPNWKLHLIIFLVALVIGSLIGFSLASRAHGATSEAPRIGRLTLPAPWWEIVKQAALENDLDPCLIEAVMAIESRFYRHSINKRHKCYGLMQLQKDVCRDMGVTDPFDPEQNIRAGAKILARLWRQNGGNIKKVLKQYNPTDTGAYSREVIKAWRQARSQQCQKSR